MRPAGWALFAVAAGCTPSSGPSAPNLPQDPWSRTERVCGWAEFAERYPPYDSRLSRGDFWWIPSEADPEDPQFPSVACVEAMFTELHVDVDAFFAADTRTSALDDLLTSKPPEGWIPGDTPFDPTDGPIATLASGIRSFFVFDLGSIDTLQPSELMSAAFVDDLRDVADRFGVDTVNQALYAYVVERVDLIRLAPLDESEQVHFKASFNSTSRTMTFYVQSNGVSMETEGGLEGMVTMVHEARHLEGPGHYERTCPPNEARAVDHDMDGSYGYGNSVVTQLLRMEPFTKYSYEETATWSIMDLWRIETFLDESCDVDYETYWGTVVGTQPGGKGYPIVDHADPWQ